MNQHRTSTTILERSPIISRSSLKVKQGKLVTVEVEYDEIIKNIKITGDFFLHPEDKLEVIEQSIIGMDKHTGTDVLASRVQSIADKEGIQMIGIDPGSIAAVIREAIQ